jgi:hypothetical protein
MTETGGIASYNATKKEKPKAVPEEEEGKMGDTMRSTKRKAKKKKKKSKNSTAKSGFGQLPEEKGDEY